MNKVFTLLERYTAWIGSHLPTFREILSSIFNSQAISLHCCSLEDGTAKLSWKVS